MIRVFLLAVVAFAALVLVAQRLPYQPPPAAAEAGGTAEDDEPRSTGPFARWDGVWEGTLTARLPDGTVVESARVRQEHTTITPTEQKVDITERDPAGRAVVRRRVQRFVGERLECRVTDAGGAVKVLSGAVAGEALIWSRREPATGREETYREEVVRLAGGDLYTIDGYRRDSAGGTLVIEGRLRRAESPAP